MLVIEPPDILATAPEVTINVQLSVLKLTSPPSRRSELIVALAATFVWLVILILLPAVYALWVYSVARTSGLIPFMLPFVSVYIQTFIYRAPVKRLRGNARLLFCL